MCQKKIKVNFGQKLRPPPRTQSSQPKQIKTHSETDQAIQLEICYYIVQGVLTGIFSFFLAFTLALTLALFLYSPLALPLKSFHRFDVLLSSSAWLSSSAACYLLPAACCLPPIEYSSATSSFSTRVYFFSPFSFAVLNSHSPAHNPKKAPRTRTFTYSRGRWARIFLFPLAFLSFSFLGNEFCRPS